MDNAGDADLKRLVEDPEDAPLVEADDDEFERSDNVFTPTSGALWWIWSKTKGLGNLLRCLI